MAKLAFKPVREDFDGAWKIYFRENLKYFLQFVDVDAYDEIDWTRSPEFLDTELRRISRGFKKNKVVVDCLVKVWLIDGEEKWILVHIELQSQKDVDFPERMFVYNTRCYDLYRVPIASYAVLADESAYWKPEFFGYGFGKSSNRMEFGILKLTDFIGQEEALERSDNPFALAVLAHLKTLETKGNPEDRYQWKLRLVRMLFQRGWERLAIESLFGFIDWIMRLPQSLEDRFEIQVEKDEKEGKAMELMSPREKKWLKMGKTEGRTEGRSEGRSEGRTEEAQFSVLDALEIRFGTISETLEIQVRQIGNLDRLHDMLKMAINSPSLQEFEKSFSEVQNR